MTPTVTVRGRGEVRVRPDRAVVRGRLETSDEDRSVSLDRLRAAQAALGEGAGVDVVFDQVRTWTRADPPDRPVHTHSASFRVELDDPGAVAATVDRLLGLDAEIGGTSWEVADDNPAHREARAAAVADAAARATDYAAGLGLARGQVVSLTDGAGAVPREDVAPMARMAGAPRGGPELQLEPDTVPVVAVAEVAWTLVPATGVADAGVGGS